jgi:hypothetical protein
LKARLLSTLEPEMLITWFHHFFALSNSSCVPLQHGGSSRQERQPQGGGLDKLNAVVINSLKRLVSTLRTYKVKKLLSQSFAFQTDQLVPLRPGDAGH